MSTSAELAEQFRTKATDELTAILLQPDDWTDAARAAATLELENRGARAPVSPSRLADASSAGPCMNCDHDGIGILRFQFMTGTENKQYSYYERRPFDPSVTNRVTVTQYTNILPVDVTFCRSCLEQARRRSIRIWILVVCFEFALIANFARLVWNEQPSFGGPLVLLGGGVFAALLLMLCASTNTGWENVAYSHFHSVIAEKAAAHGNSVVWTTKEYAKPETSEEMM